MNHFFVDKIKFSGKHIILDDLRQLHHLRDVLRIKPLEKITLFDNSGSEYAACVLRIGQEAAELELIEKKERVERGIRITVGCAIPKGAKMDDIIDKLTQLGVECIIPLETERVIVKLNKQKKDDRKSRWDKIALSASKQSQRSRLPVIKPVTGFKKAIEEAEGFEIKLIPTLEGGRKNLKDVFSSSNNEKAIVLIGPEGDFTQQEVDLAIKSGFVPVSLGQGVLRVDTAAIAVVSFIKLNEPCL